MSAKINLVEDQPGRSKKSHRPHRVGRDMLAVVLWEGKNTAFSFDRGGREEFIQEISSTRHHDGFERLHTRESIGHGYCYVFYQETEIEHLERIGCHVLEIHEWVSGDWEA